MARKTKRPSRRRQRRPGQEPRLQQPAGHDELPPTLSELQPAEAAEFFEERFFSSRVRTDLAARVASIPVTPGIVRKPKSTKRPKLPHSETLVAGPSPEALADLDLGIRHSPPASLGAAFWQLSEWLTTVDSGSTAERAAAVTAHLGLGLSTSIHIPGTNPQIGWALSGGGARGSFEAGAVMYLGSHWETWRPHVVAGTSVGAINAVGVSQWGPNCSRLLPLRWLELTANDDMYVRSQAFEELDAALKRAGSSVDELFGKGTGGMGAISGFPTWAVPLLSLPIIGNVIAYKLADVVEVVEDVLKAFSRLDRFYSLEPTRARLREQVGNYDGQVPLRLVMVSMLTGRPYYADGHGRVYEIDPAQPRQAPVSQAQLLGLHSPDALVRAAIASASIPVIFGPQGVVLSKTDKISTLPELEVALENGDKAALEKIEFHQMLDGGLRDVLPVHAAICAGADRVIAVSASVRPVARDAHFGFALAGEVNVLDQVLRTIEIMVNEVAETDRPESGRAPVIFIDPLFDVHDTMTINPGLIRLNLEYGYMRAFDALEPVPPDIAKASSGVIALWAVALAAATEEIVGLRKQIWELEFTAAISVFGIPPGGMDRDTLRAIRDMKRRVYDMAKMRRDLWRRDDSLPVSLPDGSSVSDWWLAWERHAAPYGMMLSAFGGPWQPHLVRVGGVTVGFETAAEVGMPPPATL